MRNIVWQSVAYYKALSNPKRLSILKLLGSKSERTVGEIVKALKLRQANISQHLTLLRLAGIIQMRRKGKNVYYHLK